MGKLYVFVGKSGAGKDYMMNKILEENPLCKKLVRYTTRPRRPEEVPGKDYHFITKEDYLKFKDSYNIIEEESFTVSSTDTWIYFTAADGIDFNSNIIYLTSAHIKAAFAMREKLGYDNVFIIYVNASDKTRLYRSLERENNVYEICRRFLSDEEDYFNITHKDILGTVYNDIYNSEQAVHLCNNIISNNEYKYKIGG